MNSFEMSVFFSESIYIMCCRVTISRFVTLLILISCDVFVFIPDEKIYIYLLSERM